MKNINHDLVQQLSETLDGLWRFRQYHKDAKSCKECQKLWKTLEKDFKRHETLLSGEIAKHSNKKAFN